MHKGKNQIGYSLLIKILKYTLLVITLYLVGKTLIIQISQIQWRELKLFPGFIILSILFEIGARLCTGLSYNFLLKSSGTFLATPVSIAISWVTLIGKYLPGKIGLVIGAMYLLKKYRVQTSVAGTVPVFVTILTIIVALLLSVPFLISGGDIKRVNILFGILPLICLVFSLPVFTQFYSRCVKYIIRYFENYGPVLQFSLSYTAYGFGITMCQCFCAGISTWLVINSVYPMGLYHLTWVVSITALSGVIGLMAFFSPAGIGVRDGVYFVTLTSLLGSEIAALVTVLLRLIQTLADIGTAGLGAVFIYYNLKCRKN